MKHKQVVTLIALLLAAASWSWNTRLKSASNRAVEVAFTPLMSSDNLVLRLWEREIARRTEYKRIGNNPFDPHPEVTRQASKTSPTPAPAVPEVLPPVVVQLPMKFYGYGNIPNGTARRAYLTDGNELYIATEGETLLGRYRIVKIGNATLEFEDTTLHVQGQKNLEELGAAAASNAPGT